MGRILCVEGVRAGRRDLALPCEDPQRHLPGQRTSDPGEEELLPSASG